MFFKCNLILPSVWAFGSYYQKQNFQNMLFPKGLDYDTKIEHYRTPVVNSVFGCVRDLSKVLGEIKKSDSQNLFEKSDLVPPTAPNLNEIIAGAMDLARVWDLYSHVVK